MSTKSITGTGLFVGRCLIGAKLAPYVSIYSKPSEYVPHRFHYICYICFSDVALWLEEWSRYRLDCSGSSAFTRYVTATAVHFDYGSWHDSVCICGTLVTT